MRPIHGLSALLLALFLLGAVVKSQNGTRPVVSLTPLSSEQLAVYRAVLASWTGNEMLDVNLADRTVPLDETSPFHDEECGKGLELEPASPKLVHRIRAEDLSQLGSARIRLVETERGHKEVRENDPENTMRKGGSVDDAVKNGFAHGLFTLSEIRFDKMHKHAVVSYGFVCGGLCGNGATVILVKGKDGWTLTKDRCSQWISREAPSDLAPLQPITKQLVAGS
jgi:hypothetical protein